MCGYPKEDHDGVAHVICRIIIAVHVVCHRYNSPGVFSCRCKSPDVCDDMKEDRVGVAHVICRPIIAECCLPQVQVARCMWRPERGLCWSYTRHFLPCHCSACCLPQVQVARCFLLQVQVARCFLLQVQVATCVWRPERGSCWRCTRHLPPYYCSVCCVPQVHRCKSPGVATRKSIMFQLHT